MQIFYFSDFSSVFIKTAALYKIGICKHSITRIYTSDINQNVRSSRYSPTPISKIPPTHNKINNFNSLTNDNTTSN